MSRDDDWEDEDPRPRRRRPRYDDEYDDDDYDIRRRGRDVEASGAVTALGVINIVLGSLVGLFSLCFLLAGLMFTGFAQDARQVGMNNPGVNVFALGGMVAMIVGVLILVFGVCLVLAGIGVVNRRAWGRILTLVLAGIAAVFALLLLFGIISTLGAINVPGASGSVLMQMFIFVLVVAYVIMAYTILLNSGYASEFR
jgi:hypothetical protein